MSYIKIPSNTNIYYNKKKNLLICKNKTTYQVLFLKVKIILDVKKKDCL